MGQPANPTWDNVLSPDAALSPGKGLGDPLAPDESGVSWHPAPATSHLHSFGLTAGTGRARDVVRGTSWVHVRFRLKANGRLTDTVASEYGYEFDTLDHAVTWLNELRAMEHPGSHPLVRRPAAGLVKGFLGYTKVRGL